MTTAKVKPKKREFVTVPTGIDLIDLNDYSITELVSAATNLITYIHDMNRLLLVDFKSDNAPELAVNPCNPACLNGGTLQINVMGEKE